MAHHAATHRAVLVAALLGALPGTGAAAPQHPVTLPPAKDGVITPNKSPVDPHMKVVHPKVPDRTPVIRPPARADNGKVVVEPR